MRMFNNLVRSTRMLRRKLSEFIYPEAINFPVKDLVIHEDFGFDRVKIDSHVSLSLQDYYSDDAEVKRCILENIKSRLVNSIAIQMYSEGCVDIIKQINQERNTMEYRASAIVFRSESHRDELYTKDENENNKI